MNKIKKLKLHYFVIFMLVLSFIACSQQKSKSDSLQIKEPVNKEKQNGSLQDEVIYDQSEEELNEKNYRDSLLVKIIEDQYLDLNNEAVKMLKSFYTAYINESYDVSCNLDKRDSILKEFTTENLRKQVNDSYIDGDLLINGQFCEKEWHNTMSVYEDTTGLDNFIIIFKYIRYDYDKKHDVILQKKIKLHLIKDRNEYKIDKVLR